MGNPNATSAELDPRLVEILACPTDKGPLLYFPEQRFLYNPRLRRRYAVEDGIPIMLIDEATDLNEADHDRTMILAAEQGIRENFTP